MPTGKRVVLTLDKEARKVLEEFFGVCGQLVAVRKKINAILNAAKSPRLRRFRIRQSATSARRRHTR